MSFFPPLARPSFRLNAVPKAASLGVIGLACLMLTLWIFSSGRIAELLPEWLRMLPLTACNLTLLGGALWLVSRREQGPGVRAAARGLALAVIVVALIALAGHVLHLGWNADEWLVRQVVPPREGVGPELVPLNKALGFLLTGLALLLLAAETPRRVRQAHYLALAVFANAMLALLSYLYGASAFYGLISYPGMSLQAALSFIALAAGVFCARPESGLMALVVSESAGGLMARRLLLAAVLVPTLIGWLRMLGERRGFYDTASGVSLFAVSTILTFFVIAWRNAATLHAIDEQRRLAEQALRQANNELERRVAERTAELAATNEGLRREIAERRRIEEERSELLRREQAARVQAEEYGEIIRQLQSVTDSALSHLELDDLLREMLLRVRDLLETETAVVMLLSDDGQNLSVRVTVGIEEEVVTDHQVPVGTGVVGRIAATRAPLVVNQLAGEDTSGLAPRERLRALIGAPLCVRGRLSGVLYTGTAAVRSFNEDDLRLLQLVADRVALAVEHARLYEAEQKARVQAETANRMKDEFLAVVSHELRSPLNAVLGWTTLLREGQLDAEQTGRALETIENSARSQSRLISDLLDVSRIVSGKLRLNVAPLDPARVINAALEAVRPAAAAKAIELEKHLAPDVGRILGDADRVQQIVWNLLTNAIKFTPRGGRVTVVLTRSNEHIEIVVSDTGQGIRPEFLPYVFDRFRQADVTSARKHGGLGLGLAIVRNLTEMQGGSVGVASAGEGQGATFTVKFPTAEVMLARGKQAGEPEKANKEMPRQALDSGQSAPASHLPVPSLKGVRVLVVDDDANARELCQTVLAQSAAEVRTAASVSEALAILSDWPPAVIISDIEMPEADGYALIRQVRALEQGRARPTPAIALTAYARVEDRLRALAAGFQMHVAKPVDPATLVMIISNLTGRTDAVARS